jgi:S-(hydroxymethyl)glutathione dehydrogenase/alcohol dehydrogenase
MEVKETLAAILTETGKPLVLDFIKLPDQLESGQVLVEIITSGVCGAQLNEIDAVKGPDKFLPHLLGHEGFAKVVEVGPDVSRLSVGDKVILHWRPSEGIESNTPKYKLRNQTINAGWVTTFNHHAVVSQNRMTKVESEQDKFFMPLLGCALTTALGVLRNEAKVSTADSLMIMGLGGVGNAVLQFARYFKLNNITIVDKDARKELLARQYGATHFVEFTNKIDTLQALEVLFGELGRPTIAIETSGDVRGIELCYETSSANARVILVGVPKIGEKASIYTLPLHFEKSIKGSKGGAASPDKDIPFILNLVENNFISRQAFPTESYNFSDINLALSKLREGVKGRIVLEF